MITAIHHAQITIPKGSEDEARRFYCSLLGLMETPKPEELAGSGGFWLQVGDRQIHVGTEDTVERARTKAHIAYLVDDLDHLGRLLIAEGIQVIHGIQTAGYRRFEFRDPFGNRVEFLQKLSS